MEKNETWKPVTGLEGLYEISNMGNLRSIDRTVMRGELKINYKGKLRKVFNDSKGYLIVLIRGKCVKIHRLVAQHFIPNPDNKKCVNHINGIKTDNRAKNLEWCTSSENNKHAYSNGLKRKLKGEKTPNAKFTQKEADQIRAEFSKGNYSFSSLGRKYKVKGDTIANIIRGISYA